ncbi:type II toxin-antitoxin system HicB family antitoxin [Marinomonas transparens]|uniref:Type II toxin-antitoxin system HicB family antitoxin n=1 Tax=Marinomonas transparens TaxID=2795388 RepID=A0A934JTS1_9GAMM|nr:type II toxin-antitoxin system HicB family antitoxin [Marinomonas transparens]MBJ7537169.1 type II toxin-antitoxin system HicB family antitoxin [Marinomonas transparens]
MAKKVLNYNGYIGSVDLSLEDEVMHGKIEFINDLVTYEGQTVSELKMAFECAVDDYLETCILVGKEPEKKMSGTFNIRIGAQLHRNAAESALIEEISINDFVKKAIEERIGEGEKNLHLHIHPATEQKTLFIKKDVDHWEQKESLEFSTSQPTLRLVN